MVKIVVDNNKCTGCGTCVDTCPVGVYEVKEGKSVPVKPKNVWFVEHAKRSVQKTPYKSSSNLHQFTINPCSGAFRIT